MGNKKRRIRNRKNRQKLKEQQNPDLLNERKTKDLKNETFDIQDRLNEFGNDRISIMELECYAVRCNSSHDLSYLQTPLTSFKNTSDCTPSAYELHKSVSAPSIQSPIFHDLTYAMETPRLSYLKTEAYRCTPIRLFDKMNEKITSQDLVDCQEHIVDCVNLDGRSNFASTPLENNDSKPCTSVSTATQVDQAMCSIDVGLQTSFDEKESKLLKVIKSSKTSLFKLGQGKIKKRPYYKLDISQEITIKISPSRNISLGPTRSGMVELCQDILATIKKWQDKCLWKAVDMCFWLGVNIKQRADSFYQCCMSPKIATRSNLDSESRMYEAELVTSTLEDLKREIVLLKESHLKDNDRLDLINEQLEKINQELVQIPLIKKELQELKQSKMFAPSYPPPSSIPPPPPPPPPPLPPLSFAINPPPKQYKSPNKTVDKRKSIDNSRPIISLDDILNVKLKKIGDRPKMAHRITEPQMSSLLKKVKLKPANSSRTHTSSSSSSARTPSSMSSTLSNTPCSSLTRILSNVNTNVRRVKRLQKERRL